MPRSKIDEKAVFAVCDRVYVETGRDPTYEDITSELGGSNSTVKPYLHCWLDKARPARHPLPDALAHKAGALVQAIWGYALTEGGQTTREKQREFEAQLQSCRRQLDFAVEEITNLEEHRSRLEKDNGLLIAERAELKVRLDETLTLQMRVAHYEELAAKMRDERDQARLDASAALGQVAALERQLFEVRSSERRAGRTPSKRRRRPAEPPKAAEGTSAAVG